jgi:outer membrane receptor for ferrienterochelin and colicins
LPLAAEHEHGGGHDHDNMESFDQSPDYFQLMAHATRIFKNWEVYVGGENLLNYTQHQVILGSDNPFGDTFDATRVWGPVMGTRIYAGIRLNIQQNTKP